MQIMELENFPAGENPFWHDSLSVGLCLEDFLPTQKDALSEYYIMASGFSTSYDFYIVHKSTGKRIGVKA